MTALHCPPDLGPEVVVKLDESSLAVKADDVREYLRERMSEDQIKAEIDAICELSEKRSDYGIYGMLGLKPTQQAYTCIYSGDSLLNWMHEHELKRLEQLKQALPTPGEQAAAARIRNQARIAARKGRIQAKQALHTAGSMYP